MGNLAHGVEESEFETLFRLPILRQVATSSQRCLDDINDKVSRATNCTVMR